MKQYSCYNCQHCNRDIKIKEYGFYSFKCKCDEGTVACIKDGSSNEQIDKLLKGCSCNLFERKQVVQLSLF